MKRRREYFKRSIAMLIAFLLIFNSLDIAVSAENLESSAHTEVIQETSEEAISMGENENVGNSFSDNEDLKENESTDEIIEQKDEQSGDLDEGVLESKELIDNIIPIEEETVLAFETDALSMERLGQNDKYETEILAKGKIAYKCTDDSEPVVNYVDTLKELASSLEAGKSYSVTIYKDLEVTENITFPKVEQLVLRPSRIEGTENSFKVVTIDLKGKNVTFTGANLTVFGGVRFISSASTKGNLKFDRAGQSYMITTSEGKSTSEFWNPLSFRYGFDREEYVYADGNSWNGEAWLDNVDILTYNGKVGFENFQEDSKRDISFNKTKVTANGILISEGQNDDDAWIIDSLESNPDNSNFKSASISGGKLIILQNWISQNVSYTVVANDAEVYVEGDTIINSGTLEVESYNNYDTILTAKNVNVKSGTLYVFQGAGTIGKAILETEGKITVAKDVCLYNKATIHTKDMDVLNGEIYLRDEKQDSNTDIIVNIFVDGKLNAKYITLDYKTMIAAENAVINGQFAARGFTNSEFGTLDCKGTFAVDEDATVKLKKSSKIAKFELIGSDVNKSVSLYKEEKANITITNFENKKNASMVYQAYTATEDGDFPWETVEDETRIKTNELPLGSTLIESSNTQLVGAILFDEKNENRAAYVDGTKIKVGKNNFEVWSDTKNSYIGGFVSYKDAIACINSVGKADEEYRLVILDGKSDNMPTTLSLPTKTIKGLTIQGAYAPEGEKQFQAVVAVTSDITLPYDVCFENIAFGNAENASTNKNIKLNNHTLTLLSSEIYVASVTGSATSNLHLVYSYMGVNKAITNMDTIAVMHHSKLDVATSYNQSDKTTVAISGVKNVQLYIGSQLEIIAGKSTITENLSMMMNQLEGDEFAEENAKEAPCNLILNKSAFTVKNIVTDDPADGIYYNLISFEKEAGTDATNLTVSGIVTSFNPDEENTKGVIGLCVWDVGRDAALVNVTSMEQDIAKHFIHWYEEYNDAGEFQRCVVEDTYNDKKVIRIGEYVPAAVLYEIIYNADPVAEGDITDSNNASISYHQLYEGDELKGAFDKIEALNHPEKDYRVILKRNAATNPDVNLVFPKKVKELQIVGAEDSQINFRFNNTLAINSNVVFKNVGLDSKVSASINLGKYELTLDNAMLPQTVNESGVANKVVINRIFGDGIRGTSKLVVRDCGEGISVLGNVENIGTVRICNDDRLSVYGNINIGNLDIPEGERGELTGLATITRDSAKKVTKFVPSISVNGGDKYTGSLLLTYVEKVGNQYVAVDFSDDSFANIRAKDGIQLMKAFVSFDNVDAGYSFVYSLTKGYLTAYAAENVTIVLVYKQNEEDEDIVCKYFTTWKAAVDEINALKVKREYNIVLIGDAHLETAPEPLVFPSTAYVKALNVIGDQADEGTSKIYYTGNIAFTSDVNLINVEFVQCVKNGNTYRAYAKTENPPAVSVSTSYTLHFERVVRFNTPVKFIGNNKGTFYLSGDTVLTAGNYPKNDEQYIEGSITGFSVVELSNGAMLEISKYYTNVAVKNGKATATVNSPSLTTKDLLLEKSAISLSDDEKVAANLTVTNAAINEGGCFVMGNITITNASVSSSGELLGLRNFKITGNLDSDSDEVILIGERDARRVPYLNISGNINVTDKILIGAFDEQKEAKNITLNGGTYQYSAVKGFHDIENYIVKYQTGDILLATNKGTENQFMPLESSVEDNKDEKEFYYYSKDPEKPGDISEYRGFVTYKSGNNVCISFANDVKVVAIDRNQLTSDEDANDVQQAIAEGAVIGYFADFNEATKAIEAFNNTTGKYSLIFVGNYGESNNPKALTLPQKASEVLIASDAQMGTADNMAKVYFSNDLTLKTNTKIENVYLEPYAKNSKTKAFELTPKNINAGNFSLTLNNVKERDNSYIAKDMKATGKTSQIIVKTASDVKISGVLQASNELVLEEGAKATALGNVIVNTLDMQGGALLKGDLNVKVTNVKNTTADSANTIEYNQVSAKPGFTLEGTVTDAEESTEKLVLKMNSSVDSVKLAYANNKVTLADNKCVANMAKEYTSDVVMKLNDTVIDGTTYTLVKANKKFYVVKNMDENLGNNIVSLKINSAESGDILYTGDYLDYNQALEEIKTVSDKTMIAQVSVDRITDTNLTDNNLFSSLAMPAKDKVYAYAIKSKGYPQDAYIFDQKTGRLTVNEAATGSPTSITFNGDVSATGNLCVMGIRFNATKKNNINEAGEFSFTLNMSSVATAENQNATFIGCVASGMKNVTTNSKGMKIVLVQSALTTSGTVKCTDFVLGNNAQLITKGVTEIGNIDVDTTSTTSYIATSLDKKNLPNLKVTGKVTGKIDGQNNPVVPIRVYNSGKEMDTLASFNLATGTIPFVKATVEQAAKFKLYGISLNGNTILYKDVNGFVYCGDKSAMVAKVYTTGNANNFTYAKTYADAITLIDNMKDMTADYTIEILKEGTAEKPYDLLKSASNDYVALKVPTYAKDVTIKGHVDGNGYPLVVLRFTGNMSPKTGISLENIYVTDTKKVGKEYVDSGKFVINTGSAAVVTFGTNAYTLGALNGTNHGKAINLASVTATKGGIGLNTTETVNVEGVLNVAKVNVLSANQKLACHGAVTITDVMGATGAEAVYLETDYTKATKTKMSLCQLVVNGVISNTKLVVCPVIVDVNGEKAKLTSLDGRIHTGIEVLTDAYKIAKMPKASSENVKIALYRNSLWNPVSEKCYIKQNGNLYISESAPTVKVEGYANAKYTELTYSSEFFGWNIAVDEINRIGVKNTTNAGIDNSYFKIILLNHQTESTLKMPSKPQMIKVESNTTETKQIGTVGTKITLGCDTVFGNIMLNGWNNKGVLQNLTLDTSNYSLEFLEPYAFNEMLSISGNAKSTLKLNLNVPDIYNFTFQKITNVGTVITNNNAYSYYDENLAYVSVRSGISGVNYLYIGGRSGVELLDGDINVKVLVCGILSLVRAKNIIVSETLCFFGDGKIIAGGNSKTDGKVKLANIQVVEGCNYIQAQQDQKGNSQITISGIIKAEMFYRYGEEYADGGEEAPIQVDLKKNASDEDAIYEEGTVVVVGQKVSDGWFKVSDTDMLYKSGKNVVYTKNISKAKICLYTYDSWYTYETCYQKGGELGHTMSTQSDFMTFDEAVKAIDTNSFYKENSNNKVYEDYKIELKDNIRIENNKGQLTGLQLPSKAGQIDITTAGAGDSNYAISFTGNVALKCNTSFSGVDLVPMKLNKKEYEKTAVDWNIGNNVLTLEKSSTSYEAGESMVPTIKKLSGSGKVLLGSTQKSFYMSGDLSNVDEFEIIGNVKCLFGGNITANKLKIHSPEISNTEIQIAKGNVTLKKLEWTTEKEDANVYVCIKKPMDSTFTVKEGTNIAKGNSIYVRLDNDELPISTKVMDVKNVRASDFKVLDKQGIIYKTVVKGSNLMVVGQ